MQNNKIRVAIVGVGNCCSALYQGLSYYQAQTENSSHGIMREEINGYKLSDIEVVAAFDVDKRKVGKCLGDAIFESPNCARRFCNPMLGPIVEKWEVHDGVSEYMSDQPEDRGFIVDDTQIPVDIVKRLKQSGADIVINYLPVGSQVATEKLAEACLDSGVSLLNCIPVFIASEAEWNQKFKDAGIPIVGDDMKSLFGASILSQAIQELAFSRGHKVKFHQQLNIGGNTDFNNMMVQSRLASKKKSKENVIKSQNTIRGIEIERDSIFAGPSTYIPHLKDNKVAHFRIELEGFGGAPVELDAKLSVQDSENSAGIVIDAIRYLKVARDLGLGGALLGVSAWTQKTPPIQLTMEDAQTECELLAQGEIPLTMKKSIGGL